MSKYVLYIINFIVCLDIQLNVVGETEKENSTMLKENATARWNLGSCSSLNSLFFEGDEVYQYPAVYTERCCLEPGIHVLSCHNTPPAQGWKDTHLIINGHRHCDDFMGYKSFQKISLTGKNSKFPLKS